MVHVPRGGGALATGSLTAGAVGGAAVATRGGLAVSARGDTTGELDVVLVDERAPADVAVLGEGAGALATDVGGGLPLGAAVVAGTGEGVAALAGQREP